MTRRLLFFICLAVAWTYAPPLGARLTLDVIGDWLLNIGAADLVSGPGSDLRSEYSSATAQVVVDISANSSRWRVDARKLDARWHNDFALFMRRTSDGTGTGGVSGGASYQLITNRNQTIFSGSQNRTDVHLQFKLGGISLRIPAKQFLTRVSFTVVEL